MRPVHRTNSKKAMRYVKRSEIVLCGRDEELRSCKATLEEAFIEELVAIPPQMYIGFKEKNIMSVYVPRNAFTVNETEESDFNMVTWIER